jgi:hypothetical protein
MSSAPFNVLDSSWHMLIEIVLVGLILAAALFWPKSKASSVLDRVEGVIIALSKRPLLAAVFVAAMAIASRAVLLPVLGAPVPYFPDDFSIMLQGQIFALGRLSMPTHPLHPFFESFYVNQLPHYGSMYFPGRGLPLAVGNLLFGSPWAGVWLSLIALSVGVLWMLRAWVSAPLALVGSILVIVKFGVLSGWINTYHGGGFTALGGALVLGAYPRLMRNARWRDGIALGAGLTILMISRPFEGLLFSTPLLLALAIHFIGKLAGGELLTVAKAVLPTGLLTAAGLLLMASYNLATTGDVLTDPYSQHRSTHAIAAPFLFQEKTAPSPALPANMTRRYEEEALSHDRRNSLAGLADKAFQTIKFSLQFYVGPIFMIPFLLGLTVIVTRRHFALLASGALLSVGLLVNTWDFSQYAAPGFSLFLIAIMMGFGRLRRLQFRSRPGGLFLSRALPVGAALMTAVPAAALYAGTVRPTPEPFNRSCCAVHTQTPRSMVIRQLLEIPGRDLIIVRHGLDEPPGSTLVANEPTVDQAEIVWAHDLGAANQSLLDYYPDRKVWRVDGITDTEATLVSVLSAQRIQIRNARREQ